MTQQEAQAKTIAKRPLVIAHRGFSGRYPQNTLLAFQKAYEAGADGFECDLRMTKDGEIVVFHDENLKTLCSAKGQIENLHLEQLKDLKVLHQEPIANFKDFYSLPSFKWINLEIKKSKRALDLVDKLNEVFKTNPLPGNIMISSFSTKILKHAKNLEWGERNIFFSPIFEKYSDSAFQKLKKKDWVYSWNCKFSGLPKFLQKKQKLKSLRPFWCWTTNTRDEWELCLNSELPLEALITDHPNRLVSFLNSKESSTKP